MKIVNKSPLLSKTQNVGIEAFKQLMTGFKSLVIDLGCGDGRFIYKYALKNPETLCIGIDPAEKQLEEFSKKAARKKLKNVLYVVGSLENQPKELKGCADKLCIILPWGTLLKAVSKPTADSIEKLKYFIKDDSEIEIVFGYDIELEPSETSRLELEPITKEHILNEIIPVFEENGLKLKEFAALSNLEIKGLDSTWGKRISQRKERSLYRLVFESDWIICKIF